MSDDPALTYLFLDESGKPEIYSAQGKNLVELNQASKWLVIASIRTNDQLKLQQQVAEFRLSLLKNESINSIFSSAYTLDALHANPDYIEVRYAFYEFINSLDIKIDVIAVEKLKTATVLQQNPGRLYGVMAGQLIKDQLHQTKTEVIFSRKDSKLKLQKELNIEVERQRLLYIEKHPQLNSDTNIKYLHNPHHTHGGLQIADYVAFAVFHVFENNNREWYDLISSKIGRVHDICNRRYFTKRNPL
jgi:hypothetical protein